MLFLQTNEMSTIIMFLRCRQTIRMPIRLYFRILNVLKLKWKKFLSLCNVLSSQNEFAVKYLNNNGKKLLKL